MREGGGRDKTLGAGPAIASVVGLPTNRTVYISLLVGFFKLCLAHWRNSPLGGEEISPLGPRAPEFARARVALAFTSEYCIFRR